MKRSTWTKLGLVELGALAVLWRSSQSAPLANAERDLTDDVGPKRSTRRSRRLVDCDRPAHLVG